MKRQLFYIGNHQPQGEIWVEESLVEELLKTGVYVLDKDIVEVLPELKESSDKPNKSWSEKRIKEWVAKFKPQIGYDIVNDTKADILLRLKEAGI